MCSYSILPISAADIPTIASFVHASKQPLVINRVLFKDWPNEAAQKPMYARAVESAFNDPLHETYKVVNDETGEILGHAVLARSAAGEKRETGEDGGKRQGRDEDIAKGLNPDVANEVEEAVQAVGKVWEGTEHFQLKHLFVAQAHRKRGLGSKLVKQCSDKAKAKGLPLSVFSEPAAHAFFLKLGFKDTKHADIDLTKWSPEYCGFGVFRLWGMVLEP